MLALYLVWAVAILAVACISFVLGCVWATRNDPKRDYRGRFTSRHE